jgi:hypothetical protein
VVFKNVNFKGPSKVPMVETEDLDADGNAIEKPAPVAELKSPALCITFDNAEAEHIKFIRKSLINKIKLAENYAGSAMQKAIEAYEATSGSGGSDDAAAEGEPESQEAPKAKVTPAKASANGGKPAAKKPVQKAAGEDDDVPF